LYTIVLMGKSKIEAVALFLALVAGAFILGDLRPYGWITGIGGLIVLFVLFGYDHEGVRSFLQSLAFSSVCGFALMLIVAAFFQSGSFGSAGNPLIYTVYLPIAWLCATCVFIVIDRARMGSRFQASLGPTSLGIPEFQPRNRAGSVSDPVYVQPEAPASEPEPVQAEPAEAASERTAMHEIPASPIDTPAPPAIPARAVPLPHRKETGIYISLVGEGIAVMRPVRAEHLGKDFYLITEPMPEGENWEFTTGQIVRCKKKSLSHGKALVAIQEAPRAS
ncbi:MAG: hypothetical protein ACRD4O_15425, partial [Bryobacteraceae bacterium]